MQAEVTATRQALNDLHDLLTAPLCLAPPTLSALRESANRCAGAAHNLRARQRDLSHHTEQVQGDLLSARRTNAEMQWEVCGNLLHACTLRALGPKRSTYGCHRCVCARLDDATC